MGFEEFKVRWEDAGRLAEVEKVEMTEGKEALDRSVGDPSASSQAPCAKLVEAFRHLLPTVLVREKQLSENVLKRVREWTRATRADAN